MRSRSIIAGLTALTLTAIGVGDATQAMAAREVRPATISGRAFLGLAGKPGSPFGVELSTAGAHVAVLDVGRSPRHELPSLEWTKYAVRPLQPLASGTLRAEFGSIGTVSLRFEYNGESKPGRLPNRCAGPRPRVESGVYRGSISLLGEEGSFRLRRFSADGWRKRSFRLSCAVGHGADPTAEPPLSAYVEPHLFHPPGIHAQLETTSESAGLSTGLFAVTTRGDSFGTVSAGTLESLPEMAIGRYFYEAGPGFFRTHTPGPGLVRGAVGSATYNGDPALPGTWSAQFLVSFPGKQDVLLNGPGSRTRLCIVDPFARPSECVGESDPLLSGGPFDPFG